MTRFHPIFLQSVGSLQENDENVLCNQLLFVILQVKTNRTACEDSPWDVKIRTVQPNNSKNEHHHQQHYIAFATTYQARSGRGMML